jgi:hypothetical protein
LGELKKIEPKYDRRYRYKRSQEIRRRMVAILLECSDLFLCKPCRVRFNILYGALLKLPETVIADQEIENEYERNK